jgi:hypothetical protein
MVWGREKSKDAYEQATPEKSLDPAGNQTPDHPACSLVKI